MFHMKKIILFVIVIILFISSMYLIMFINTNSVVNYVEKVFRGEISYDEIKDSPLERYYVTKDIDEDYPGENLKKIDVSISRKFVFHNFKNGYMWVRYSYKAYNSEGELMFGAIEPKSIWKIQKQNREWKIISIEEHPFE